MHHIVASKLIAIVGAPLADRGARRADAAMFIGTAQHEVGARLADARTVEEQRHMRDGGVVPTLLETVGKGREAHLVATHTLVDAPPNGGIDQIHRGSRHDRLLLKVQVRGR